MNEIVFSGEAIAAHAVIAVLCILIPVGAALVWRFCLKKGSMKYTFIGAGMFFLFAIILERLLHQVMLPLVSGNVLLYTLYGALAAGIFEETARYISFRFLMKYSRSAENAVSYGLGHGGFEAIYLAGITSISVLMMAAEISSSGTAQMIQNFTGGSEAVAEQLRAQLVGFSQMTIPTALISVFERIVAMALHVSLSVLVMESVMVKGKAWLYPAAMAIHALMDVPALLYQSGKIPLLVCEAIMTAFTAVWVFVAIRYYKALRAK